MNRESVIDRYMSVSRVDVRNGITYKEFRQMRRTQEGGT